MKKILVTGGAGFIGTHLCRELLRRGYSVRTLDIQNPKNHVEGVEYIQGDIRDREMVARVIQDVEAVYQLAAVVSVSICQDQPTESYQVNTQAAVEVAHAVIREGTQRGKPIRLLFAGSSAVYGMLGKPELHIAEDMPLPEPLSFYAGQKLATEQAYRIFARTKGLPVVNFRFFNVYGPGQDRTSPYSGVISVFTELLDKNTAPKLNDGGFQTRDFVSVLDLARALASALDLPAEKCDGLPINLGTSRAVTIRELAEMMIKVKGKSVSPVVAPAREGDVPYSLANISRAQKLLGWEPQISLEAGLRELLGN